MSSTSTTWTVDTNTKSGGAQTFSTSISSLKILGEEGGDAILRLFADEGDDNADQWRIVSSSSTNKLNFMSLSSGSWSTVLDLYGAGGAVVINEDSADIDFRVESDDNTHMLFVDGGNDRVGIGTGSPSTMLDITSSSSTSAEIQLDSSANTSGINVLRSDTDRASDGGSMFRLQVYNQSTEAGAMYFIRGSADTKSDFVLNTSNSERMRIDEDGNVGIGDDDPSEAKLSITGVLAGDVGLKIDHDIVDTHALQIDAENTTGRGLDIECDALTTGEVAKFYSNASTTDTRSLVNITNDNTAATGATALEIEQDSIAKACFIDHNISGTAASNGTTVFIDFDRTDPGSGTHNHNDVAIDIEMNSSSKGTSTAKGIDMDVVGAGTGSQVVTGIDVAVSGGNTNYAALFTGGNVGIGTTSPSDKLHVASSAASAVGDIRVETAVAATSPPTIAFLKARGSLTSLAAIVTSGGDLLGSLSFWGYDGSNYREGATMQAISVATSSTGTDMPAELVFKTSADGSSAPTQRMVIDKDGNVGIGTTAPDQKVDISGDGATLGIGINCYSDTEAHSGILQFNKSDNTAASKALIDDDAVLGDIQFRGYDGDAFLHGAGIIARINGTPEDNVMPCDLEFWTNDGSTSLTQRMTISESGNVGIGVAAPSALLHIKKTGMTDETSVAMTADGTGNSARRYAEFGVHYNSGATVDAPCAFIRMDATDDVTHYIWANNDDDLFASSTIANIGTTTGTKIGDMTSDERLKNISEDLFPYGLAEVNNLVPIKYSMKADATNKQKLGFGGQTTQSIIPEVVHDTGECIDGYTWGVDEKGNQINQVANSDDKDTKLSMSYNGIIPVLVKAIQELSAEVEKLKNK